VPGASGQQQPVARFDDRADVVVLEFPVQVLERGEPVRGLTAGDFVARSGKRALPIVGLEEIDWTRVPEAERSAAPLVVRRHILFLFDLSFSRPPLLLRAREAAKQVVAQDLQPGDLAGVASWSQAQGSRLVLNFTTDRRQLVAALDSMGLADPIDVPGDP
jgi:hypothetical protein